MIKSLKKIFKSTCLFITLLGGLAIFNKIPLAIFNIDINKFNPNMKVLYNFSCDIGYMIILFFIYKETLINDFKNFKKEFTKNMDICFKYYFIGFIIMAVSNIIISIFFKGANANNETAVRGMISIYPLYMLFSVSIYAPFTEELIFRKSIKDIVPSSRNNKFTKYIYIILSGIIFASLHVLKKDASALDYLYIISYLGLGLAFSSLYYKTNNIFSSMTMHFVHNTVAILLLLLVGV